MLPKLSFILKKSLASIFPRSWASRFTLQFTDLQAAHCVRGENIHIIYIFESSLFLVIADTEKLFQQEGFLQDAVGQGSKFLQVTISPIGHRLRVYTHSDNTCSPGVDLLLLLLLGLACCRDLLAVLASEMLQQNRHPFKKSLIYQKKNIF